jgi:hypothetical protein
MTQTPYRITVHLIECCNCNHGCNCQFAGYPDHGNCEFLQGGEIIEGRFGDVSLGGVRWVTAIAYPGAIHEGNGRVALYIDEKASDQQFSALAMILSGQAGGMPWEALAGTIASLYGPYRAPIEVKVNGTRSSIRVPSKIDLQQTPIRDAVSGEEKEIQLHYPKGGFMWNTGNVCTTSTMLADTGEIRFSHPNGYACYATMTWTNQPK